jgi:pimeloyl-ACP methyl ester carboxylesterase
MGKWLKRLIFTIGALLLATTGYHFIQTKMDQQSYPPLGQMIDVGGYKLHLHSTGSGGPAVILEAGLGCIGSDWGLVQEKLSLSTQVVSYDRAGMGCSEQSPHPRTSRQIVLELHTLLEKAQVPKPYILVGHSFGGHNIQLYAATYPDEVLGLVLVDSCHPDQEKYLPRHPKVERKRKLAKSPKTVYFLSSCGIFRLLSPKYLKAKMPFLPDSLRKRHLALCSTTKHDSTLAQEASALKESLAQLDIKAQKVIQSKPCVVISAGKPITIPSFGVPSAFANEMHTAWDALQTDLASRFTQSLHLIAEESDHMILWHQSDLIVSAVKELIYRINIIFSLNLSISIEDKTG